MKTLAVIWLFAILAGYGAVTYITTIMDERAKFPLVTEDYKGSSLKVEQGKGMQPFRASFEDELSATQALEPTHIPQVTLHYYHIQGTDPVLQASKTTLQGDPR